MAFLFRIALLSSLIAMMSCHSGIPEDSITKSELLAGTNSFGKTYRIDDIEIFLGDLTIKSCIADNFITYYPDGRYEMGEGATKCHPDDPRAVEGYWELIASDRKILLDLGDSTITWDIDQLNESRHEIGADFTEGYRLYTLVLSN